MDRTDSKDVKRPMLVPIKMAICLVAVLPQLSCDRAPGGSQTALPAEVEWPEGTVLAIGGEPITAQEIDRYVDMVHLIEPHLVKRDHRRKALSNVILPIAIGRALVPETDRQAAFQEAERLASAAKETGTVPEGAAEVQYLTGTWKEVGMTVWNETRSTSPGSFSGVIETPGAWTFVHLLATTTEPGEAFSPTTVVTMQRYDVYYYDREGMRDLIQDGFDNLRVEVVDPEWEAVVPPLYLYPSSKKP